MSYIFEVYRALPVDVDLESKIGETVKTFGGKLTYRESPESDGSRNVILTFEFDHLKDSKEAAAQLRTIGEHVEGPMDYGND